MGARRAGAPNGGGYSVTDDGHIRKARTMTTTPFARLGIVAAVATVLVVTGCSPDTPAEPGESAPPGELRTVSITQSPLTYYAPVWIADEQGIFEKHGIQIEFAESVPTGAGQIAMITSGQVDVIASAPASMMQALAEGLQTQFVSGIADFATSDETDAGALIVTADSEVESPGDLNGMTVGVSSINSMQQSKVMATIDEAGGDASTVEFVQVPPASMSGLLQSGEIDAASPFQPELTALLQSGDFRRIGGVNWVALGGTPGLSIASTPQWIAENEDVADAIHAAITEAVEWANDPANRDGLNEVIAAHLDSDVAVLEDWVPDVYNADVSLEALEKLQDHLIEYDLLGEPVDLESMIRP